MILLSLHWTGVVHLRDLSVGAECHVEDACAWVLNDGRRGVHCLFGSGGHVCILTQSRTKLALSLVSWSYLTTFFNKVIVLLHRERLDLSILLRLRIQVWLSLLVVVIIVVCGAQCWRLMHRAKLILHHVHRLELLTIGYTHSWGVQIKLLFSHTLILDVLIACVLLLKLHVSVFILLTCLCMRHGMT